MNKDDKVLIVADAGGTKTDWFIWSPKLEKPIKFQSGAINAAVTPEHLILASVKDLREYLVDLSVLNEGNVEFNVYFFGAGCATVTAKSKIHSAFSDLFINDCLTLSCGTDILGAAIALFGEKEGLCCILGTGSATGFYNGREITMTIPSLGYILGDEGSGSFMGKALLNRYFKKNLSSKMHKALEACHDMNLTTVIDKTYRLPGANAYLASFVGFIKENEKEPDINEIIDESLKLFFKNNVLKYNLHTDCKIGFSGGVAWQFADRIQSIGRSHGFESIGIIRNPIDDLGGFFMKKDRK